MISKSPGPENSLPPKPKKTASPVVTKARTNPTSQKQPVPSGTTLKKNMQSVKKAVSPVKKSITQKKESVPPPDVQEARQQQTAALLQRQDREVRRKNLGGIRDVDAGTGGQWSVNSPLL